MWWRYWQGNRIAISEQELYSWGTCLKELRFYAPYSVHDSAKELILVLFSSFNKLRVCRAVAKVVLDFRTTYLLCLKKERVMFRSLISTSQRLFLVFLSIYSNPSISTFTGFQVKDFVPLSPLLQGNGNVKRSMKRPHEVGWTNGRAPHYSYCSYLAQHHGAVFEGCWYVCQAMDPIASNSLPAHCKDMGEASNPFLELVRRQKRLTVTVLLIFYWSLIPNHRVMIGPDRFTSLLIRKGATLLHNNTYLHFAFQTIQ